MEKIEEVLASENKSIERIVDAIQYFIQEHWLQVWKDEQEELLSAYSKGGDQAYALYTLRLLRPVEMQFKQYGVSSEPRFPGTFPMSLEKWGPMEERERCFWSVLKDEQGHVLGSVVLRFYHDHTNLRLPQMPRVIALDRNSHALSSSPVRSVGTVTSRKSRQIYFICQSASLLRARMNVNIRRPLSPPMKIPLF